MYLHLCFTFVIFLLLCGDKTWACNKKGESVGRGNIWGKHFLQFQSLQLCNELYQVVRSDNRANQCIDCVANGPVIWEWCISPDTFISQYCKHQLLTYKRKLIFQHMWALVPVRLLFRLIIIFVFWDLGYFLIVLILVIFGILVAFLSLKEIILLFFSAPCSWGQHSPNQCMKKSLMLWSIFLSKFSKFSCFCCLEHMLFLTPLFLSYKIFKGSFPKF